MDKVIGRQIDKVVEQSTEWTCGKKDKIILGMKAKL